MMDRELQEQYYKLEMYGQQVKKLQEEFEKVELMKMELLKSIESMKEIEKTDDIIMPLGGGAFVKVKVESQKVIVGTGADIFVEKEIPSVIEDFEKTIEDLNSAGSMLISKIEETTKEAEKLQNELESKMGAMESMNNSAE